METKAQSGTGATPPLPVRFGPFELDLRGGELRREGRRTRLQEQPFQILRMLLESPGQVVSREDIRKRLWPDNTVVEFDHSINAAVKRLRDALRDSAEKPRYIETVARRGYRFVGEVDMPASRPALAEPMSAAASAPTNGGFAETSPHRPGLPIRPWILVLLVIAIALLFWTGVEFNQRRAGVPVAHLQPLMRLDLDIPGELPPGSEPGGHAILSPDGTRLVYISGSKLFLRQLDQPYATQLPGTENPKSPFFSPDSRFIAFFSGENLIKVAAAGGAAIKLATCPLGNGGSWGEDGWIIAGCNFTLSKLPSTGGIPKPVTELGPGEIVHRWPQILPGGKAVVFTAYPSVTGLEGAAIEVLSLPDGHRKTLVRGGTWGRYVPSGHLVYIEKGTLFAIRFDVDRLEAHGTPAPVLPEVAYSSSWGSAQLDISRTGTLVYRSSRTSEGLVTVQWLDKSGNTRPLLPVPGNYLSPTLSPDGTQLALILAGDIWVYQAGRGKMIRLTYGGGYGNPLWSADGRYIVFRAARGIWWTRADGTAQPQPLTQSSNQQTPWSFTADGRQLAFVEIDVATGADIWTVAVENGGSGLRAGRPEVFLRTRFHERGAMFSPDGHWMAYMSNESGTYQLYVQGVRNKGAKYQISTNRGGYPAWSRKGNDLFYWELGVHSRLMAVSYRSRGDSFVADKPRVWSTQIAGVGTTRSYDPAPDGHSIVALMPADNPQEPYKRLTFLLNFFDDLQRRVPPGPRG